MQNQARIYKFTCVFREAYRQGRLPDFLLEQVLLVEEEDYGRVCEPLVVADRVEQFQTLLHPVLKSCNGTVLLVLHLIINFTHCAKNIAQKMNRFNFLKLVVGLVFVCKICH